MSDNFQAEQIRQMLAEQSPACHWAMDREHRFRFVSGNPEPFFGSSAERMLGRCVDEILPGEAGATWSTRVDCVLSGQAMVLRERAGEKLFGIAWFPVRAGDGEILFAGGFAFDVTALSTGEQALRSTTMKMLKATQGERARVSKFLHDEVGQCLSAMGLHLDLLRLDFAEQCPGIAERTVEMQRVLESVMSGVRDYSYALNPDIVERAGLGAALDRLAGLRRKEFGGTLRLMADSSVHFPPPVGSAVYKIAQEALDNALEHGGCSQIEIITKSSPSGPTLEVRDNGKGFDSADLGGAHRGLGLLFMEHYAERANLRLSIDSEKGSGTVVRAVYQGTVGEG